MDEKKEYLEQKELDEEEQWKIIEGYEEERYEISNFGRVRRWTHANHLGLIPLQQPRYLIPRRIDGIRVNVDLCQNNKRKKYMIHRLVALHFVYNHKPTEYNIVDHIDGNQRNNHYTNLRWCSQHLNHLNSKKQSNNTSGYKGICWNKRDNKWLVRIYINYKQIRLGCFKSIEEAIRARQEAEKKYFNSDFYISDRV